MFINNLRCEILNLVRSAPSRDFEFRVLGDHLLETVGNETDGELQIFAGAFGSFIDPKYAMVLGLIPDCDLTEVKAVGNAAGTGALMALLNRDSRREIERAVNRIEKIETALEPKFQEFFVHAMALPNKVDAFPYLSTVVTLPERWRSARCVTSSGRPVRASSVNVPTRPGTRHSLSTRHWATSISQSTVAASGSLVVEEPAKACSR